MKQRDLELILRVSDQSWTTTIYDRLRGFWGVALITNPITNYRMISKACQSSNQSVTIRVGDVDIITAHLSTKATAEEELELLKNVESHNNRKAIIVCDINATHSDWDTGNTTRGRRLKTWVTTNG